MALQKISPFLWYTSEAEEAATVYTALFPDSRIVRVTKMGCDAPDAPPGAVTIVEFLLFGQKFTAMSAGPQDPFNHAISFVVRCADQAEVDRYWDGLLEGGGTPEQCGWLRDRFGVCWQVVPDRLMELLDDADRAKAARASDAMLKMVKIDIAALEAAAAQA